jgi:hypothetical protein
MDVDTEDGSHREGPVAVNTSPSISIKTADDTTKADNGTSTSVTPAPLPQPTTETTAPTTSDITTETENDVNHHNTAISKVGTTPQRVPYKYDPGKITLRFLFANRDGLTVQVTCNPSDTIGEVKGALISIWPEGK